MKMPRHLKSNSLLLKSATSVITRITTVATMIISTGIASRMMTNEEFGLWTIFISLSYILSNLDFGFRYSMGNRLAALVAIAGGKIDNTQKELFLSIFYLQLALALIGALIAVIAIPIFSWVDILKISDISLYKTINFNIIMVLILFFFSFPFMLANSGFFAFQEINLFNILSASQSLLQLSVFIIASQLLSFKWVLFAYYFSNLICQIVLTRIFLLKREWKFSWIILATQIRHINSLFRQSLNFFILSISSTITSALSTFLVGTVGGLSIAGNFDLLRKLFGLLATLHLALLAPLAPSFTQEAQLGNWNWINKRLSFALTRLWPLIFLGAGGLIYIFHPLILKLWTGRDLADYRLAGLLGLGVILVGWGNTYSVILNSLGLIRFQAMISIVIAPLYIFFPIILGKEWGAIGVALGTLLCMLPSAFILPMYTKFAIRGRLLNV